MSGTTKQELRFPDTSGSARINRYPPMRSLDRARQQALRCRPLLGDDLASRLDRLVAYLAEHHGVRPLAVGSDFLHGGRGEVAPAEGLLYYDRKLDDKGDDKLELFAHELGHLVLHERLTQTLVPGDPIRGSAYLEHGTPALARYSRRSFEEAEATAFAAELLCPADEVFAAWRAAPAATTESLAAAFGVSAGLARVQLAEGLYRFVRGPVPGAEGAGDELTTNPDQEEAALWTGTPVLVEAGPGTGKTRTLVRRVIHLIRERGVAAEEVLVLTFSNEAAEELRLRLERSLGPEPAARVLIATFHGLGVLVLHTYGHLIGLGPEFAILDDIGQEEILTEVLGRVDCEAILSLHDPQVTIRQAAHYVGYLKDRLWTPARLAGETASWSPAEGERQEHARAQALQRVFAAYEDEKRRLDRVDFADLVLLPLAILEEHEEVRRFFRERFRWVMVDEYQDVGRSMAMLLTQLCGHDNPPWVVGDARQAIYRFRGAAPENVRRFGDDFPGARTFFIELNYRSSPPVVDAANRLAALMEGEDAAAPRRRWRPGSDVGPLGGEPVAIVETSSDAAERRTIVEQVRAWIERGVAPGEIGVLARRNIDVRNAALALADAGIRAVTSGLVTAEGAAGDLAAAVTALDAPRAAVPRLVYALGRGRHANAALNAAVRHLLAELEKKEEEKKDDDDAAEPPPQAREVVAGVHRFFAAMRPLEHSGDGWTVLLTFLFDASDYLRRLIGDGLEAELALEEIVSALAFAGTYRFGHPGTPPRRSRARMAERLRELLCNAAPGLIPPRPQAGAVRVMTCHASKGLEFPCVVVAGQTLNVERTEPPWLPPPLRPDREEDRKQADSLLFVGVTRAERAVVVSYASTAGGTVRSPRRTLPRLLEQWIASRAVPVRSVDIPPEPSEPVTLGPIWGGRAPDAVSLYSLSGRQCGILGYLQDHLGIGFRPVLVPLYPVFVTRLRRALRRVVDQANAAGRPVTPEEAEAIAAEEWPDDKYAEHPHRSLYRPRALRWARELARAYVPPAGGTESLDHEIEWQAGGEPTKLPLQLIGRYRDADGSQYALLFRPESLGAEGTEALKWSDLREHHRLPLALLGDDDPELRPRVYSGADGQIYPYKWSHQKPRETLSKVESRARELLDLQSSGVFRATIKDWTCDRCSCRMLCPFWMGAAEDEPDHRESGAGHGRALQTDRS